MGTKDDTTLAPNPPENGKGGEPPKANDAPRGDLSKEVETLKAKEAEAVARARRAEGKLTDLEKSGNSYKQLIDEASALGLDINQAIKMAKEQKAKADADAPLPDKFTEDNFEEVIGRALHKINKYGETINTVSGQTSAIAPKLRKFDNNEVLEEFEVASGFPKTQLRVIAKFAVDNNLMPKDNLGPIYSIEALGKTMKYLQDHGMIAAGETNNTDVMRSLVTEQLPPSVREKFDVQFVPRAPKIPSSSDNSSLRQELNNIPGMSSEQFNTLWRNAKNVQMKPSG